MAKGRESDTQDSKVINPNLLRREGSEWTEGIEKSRPETSHASLGWSVRGGRLWECQKSDCQEEDREDSEGMEEDDRERQRDVEEVLEEIKRVDKERRMDKETISIVLY
jgi:hypothetical protein